MKNLFFILFIIAINAFSSQKTIAQSGKTIEYTNAGSKIEKLTFNIFYIMQVTNKVQSYALHNENEGLSKPNSTSNGLIESTTDFNELTSLVAVGDISLWNIQKSVDTETGIEYYYKTDSTYRVNKIGLPSGAVGKYKQVNNSTNTWQQNMGITNTIAEQKGEKKRYSCNESNMVSGKSLYNQNLSELDYFDQNYNPKLRYNPKNKNAELSDWFVPIRIEAMDSTCLRTSGKGGDLEKCTQASFSTDATDEVKQKIEGLATVVNSWNSLFNTDAVVASGEMRFPPYKAEADYTNASEFLANAVLSSKEFDVYNYGDKSCSGALEHFFKIKEVKKNEINQDSYWQNVYEDQNVSIRIFLRLKIAPMTMTYASSEVFKDYNNNEIRHLIDREFKGDEVSIDEVVKGLPSWVSKTFFNF
jgi:hypothetical protein